MSDSQRRFRGDAAPTRQKADLADLVELLLDKGIVVNADVIVTVGETELLGVYVRAAIASFETAAKYGLDFPEGTDMERVREAAGVEPLEGETGESGETGEPVEPGEQARLTELDVGPDRVDELDSPGEPEEGDESEETASAEEEASDDD